jgi:hypothetical protein
VADTPHGFCHCGCGGKTTVYYGTPRKYISGHNARRSPVDYLEQDCGHPTPCWVWQRFRNSQGYGTRTSRPGSILAHRQYYEDAHGPIPEGLQLDHLCSNPSCVRPDHLEPVTGAENARRSRATKLTVDDVRAIRAAKGITQAELGARYGVNFTTISAIQHRRNWADVA